MRLSNEPRVDLQWAKRLNSPAVRSFIAQRPVE
jgi:hypothetical protein